MTTTADTTAPKEVPTEWLRSEVTGPYESSDGLAYNTARTEKLGRLVSTCETGIINAALFVLLVMGPMGAGKSALLSTWLTALMRGRSLVHAISDLFRSRPTGAAQGTATQHFQDVSLQPRGIANFRFCDSWGTMDNGHLGTYAAGVASSLVVGSCKPNSSMFECNATGGSRAGVPTCIGDMCNALLICVPSTALMVAMQVPDNSPEPGWTMVKTSLIRSCSEALDKAHAIGIPVFYILTQCDQLDPEVAAHPAKAATSQFVNKARQLLFDALSRTTFDRSVTLQRILPSVAYSTHMEPCLEMDFCSLLLMYTIQQEVIRFFSSGATKSIPDQPSEWATFRNSSLVTTELIDDEAKQRAEKLARARKSLYA